MRKIFLPLLFTVFSFCFAMKSNAQWQLTGNANATATSRLGTTNAVPLGLYTKNTQRLFIDTMGRVGIGTPAPINILTVKGAGSTPVSNWTNKGAPLFVGFGETAIGNADYILAMASADANARPVILERRSRGTLAAPTVVANNDFLASILSSGYDGSSFQNPAAIDFYVDSIPSTGNVPTRISFVTGSNTANRAERLKIGNTGDISMNINQFFLQKSSGNVGIGTTNPAAKLEVAGDILVNGITIGRGNGNINTNTAMGVWTLKNNTTGYNNVANGYFALLANTTGVSNTANGYGALGHNTTGSSNVANGYFALAGNTNGEYNVANGSYAMGYNATGSANVANGVFALGYNTTGDKNVANGTNALYSNTTGYDNVANGYGALYDNKTGNYNTGIGTQANVYPANLTNATAIGYTAVVDASNKVRIGNGSVTSIGGQVAWTNFSDARIKDNVQENVPGLAFLKALRPVTYHYNISKQDKLMGIKEPTKFDGKYDIEKIQFTGFLAQDVDAAAKSINYDFSGVDKSGKIMGLRYSEFVVPLVKAVQELSVKNEEQAKTNEALQKQIDELKDALIKVVNQQKCLPTTSK